MTNNMYDFAATWSPLGGECLHQCTYCYVEAQKANPFMGKNIKAKYSGEPRLSIPAMKENLNNEKYDNKVIFVESMGDLFAENVPEHMIKAVLEKCANYPNRQFFFQTKNPKRIRRILPPNSIVCVTIETNRHYPDVMKNAPKPIDRYYECLFVRQPLQITIEPIMDFDLDLLTEMIKAISPIQCNLGADSKKHNLPEPPKEKILSLIAELEKFTTVHIKPNLNRLIQ
jgi:DNA repair photolyase